MTVFMSTHTLGMAEEMASRMGIMVHGNLKFLGTVSYIHKLTHLIKIVLNLLKTFVAVSNPML